jgi:hypothetical protein
MRSPASPCGDLHETDKWSLSLHTDPFLQNFTQMGQNSMFTALCGDPAY